MLVLSRKVGERLVLTGGISISVVSILGNKVRLGIEAPKEINVVRDELLPKEAKAQETSSES
jgi:carbon storage regulator